MDISIYLIELIRIHDCVIVPELGGFISNYQSAGVDYTRNTFAPPRKEIVFNSKLTGNDGLLVNHISESEGIGYLEARQIIAEFVDEAWSKLENGEKLDFSLVGSLHYDRHEKLIFEPEQSENLLLDSYGMGEFHFPKIERNDLVRATTRFEDKEAVRVVFNSRTAKKLLIGVPLMLALTLIPLSKHLQRGDQPTGDQASTTTSVLSVIDSTPADTFVSTDKIPAESIPVESKAKPDAEESLADNQTASEPSLKDVKMNTSAEATRFYLVGGSFKSEVNAKKYQDDLIRQGYDSQIFTLENGFYRVTIQSYNDRDEALAVLDNLTKANPKSGIWLLEE